MGTPSDEWYQDCFTVVSMPLLTVLWDAERPNIAKEITNRKIAPVQKWRVVFPLAKLNALLWRYLQRSLEHPCCLSPWPASTCPSICLSSPSLTATAAWLNQVHSQGQPSSLFPPCTSGADGAVPAALSGPRPSRLPHSSFQKTKLTVGLFSFCFHVSVSLHHTFIHPTNTYLVPGLCVGPCTRNGGWGRTVCHTDQKEIPCPVNLISPHSAPRPGTPRLC